MEKSLPSPLGCFADAFPPAQYYWQFERAPTTFYAEGDGDKDDDGDKGDEITLLDATNTTITEGHLRHFRHPVGRKQVQLQCYRCSA